MSVSSRTRKATDCCGSSAAVWGRWIEGRFQALRYFALDGTDHRSHQEQNTMIRRYIAWRNRHAHDEALRAISKRASIA